MGLGDAPAVARLSALIWVRELARSTGLTQRGLRGFAIAVGAAAVGWGALVAAMTLSTLGTVSSSPDQVADIVHSGFSGALLLAGVICSVACLFSPPGTIVAQMLDLLPVSRAAALIGDRAPMAVGSAGIAALLGFSGFAVAVRTAGSLGAGAAACAALALSILTVTMTWVALFLLVVRLGSAVFHLPAAVSSAIAGGVGLGGAIWAFGGGVFGLDGPAQALLRALSAIHARPGDLAAWAVVVGCAAGAGVVLLWAASLRPGTSRVGGGSLLRLPLPARRLGALAWYEATVLLRAPYYSLLVVLTPIAIGGGAWAGRTLQLPIGALATQTMAMSGALVVAQSFGRTLPLRWITHLTPSPSRLEWPGKALGAAAVHFSITVEALLAGWVFDAARLPELVGYLVAASVAYAAALLGGQLIPYSESQGVSGPFTMFMVFALAAPGSLVAAFAGGALGDVVGALALLLIALALLAWSCLLDRHRSAAVPN